MRVDELESREAFGDTLSSTLSAMLRRHWGGAYEVSFSAGEQSWHCHRLLSAFFVPHASSEPRRYLKDSLRYTGNRWRSLPQFIVGTALGSRIGLRASRTYMTISPALPNAESLLIIPGNQRIRILDFAQRRCFVEAKVGFPTSGMANDIAVRGSRPCGFVPILESDSSGRWFVEPLVTGVSLARCPPWRNARHASERAFSVLDQWRATSVRTVLSSEYADELGDAFEAPYRRATEQWREVRWLGEAHRALRRALRETERVEVSQTHGDFQPGNVLMSRDGGVHVIDCEHVGTRSSTYDRLVFGFSSRWGTDYASALARLAAGESPLPGASPVARLQLRRAQLLAFVLEEVAFYLGESVDRPYKRCPGGLAHLCTLMPKLCSALQLEGRTCA